MQFVTHSKNVVKIAIFFCVAALSVGCGLFRGRSSARTPLPTFTPTQSTLDSVDSVEGLVRRNDQTAQVDELIVVTQAPALTLTPLPTMTFVPTATPPLQPTETQPTIIPQTPTPTLRPTPTPVPEMLFDLEDYTKFPTLSLSQDVVRIYLYVYSIDIPALSGYSLLVRHNDVILPVEGESTGGLPNQTRDMPGPYNRCTNFDTIFVGLQAGSWSIQLVDNQGVVLGPPAQFELTAEEETRELYVRYVRKAQG